MPMRQRSVLTFVENTRSTHGLQKLCKLVFLLKTIFRPHRAGLVARDERPPRTINGGFFYYGTLWRRNCCVCYWKYSVNTQIKLALLKLMTNVRNLSRRYWTNHSDRVMQAFPTNLVSNLVFPTLKHLVVFQWAERKKKHSKQNLKD